MLGEDTPRGKLTSIGSWKLGHTLGRGAYANVRLAIHPTGHKAACKILPALYHTKGRSVTPDEMRDAIEAHKELVLLKALAGGGVEGVAGLEGVMAEDGWTYAFLTLYPRSASSVPVPWSKDVLVPFFRRICLIAQALHSLDISHEDLKRSNILIDSLGYPVFIDFGFSHFKPDGGIVKSLGGTLDYSSPEKVADGHYDPRANDVWSLGILLLKIAGLAHPYNHDKSDDTSSDIKSRILLGDEKWDFTPQQLRSGGIGDLAMGMLHREPEKRWTLSRVLRHPFLQTKMPDPKPFIPQPKRLPLSLKPPFPLAILEDLCFLAYEAKQFYLCETPLKIVEKLTSVEPCWEKRWAGMLAGWEKRAEMDWEDVIKITATKKAPRTARPSVLREIHLTPERNSKAASKPRPVLASTTVVNIPHVKLRPVLHGMKKKDGTPEGESKIPVRTKAPILVTPKKAVTIQKVSQKVKKDKRVPRGEYQPLATSPPRRQLRNINGKMVYNLDSSSDGTTTEGSSLSATVKRNSTFKPKARNFGEDLIDLSITTPPKVRRSARLAQSGPA